MEDIVNGFISEEEENMNINETQAFNASDYESKKIICYFKDKGLLEKDLNALDVDNL